MEKLLIAFLIFAPFFAQSQTTVFQTLRHVGTSAKTDTAQMTTISVTASQITVNGAVFNIVSTVNGSIGQNRVIVTENNGEFILLFEGEELNTVIHNPKRGKDETKVLYCQPLKVIKIKKT